MPKNDQFKFILKNSRYESLQKRAPSVREAFQKRRDFSIESSDEEVETEWQFKKRFLTELQNKA